MTGKGVPFMAQAILPAARVALTRPPAPFVKWVGGKRQLLPQILAALGSAHLGTYFEPFVG